MYKSVFGVLLAFCCSCSNGSERIEAVQGSATTCGAGDGGTAGASAGAAGASAGMAGSQAGASAGSAGASAGASNGGGGAGGSSAGAPSGGGSSCSTVTIAASSHSTVYWSLSPTFAHPAGAQAGDVLVLIDSKVVGNAPANVITLPAGWALERRQDRSGSSLLFGMHVDTGAEPAVYTETVTESQYNRFAVIALRGVDPSNPLGAMSGAGNFAYNWTEPSLTATIDGSLWFVGFQAPTDPTNPNGLARVLNEDQLHVLSKTVTAGATGAINANFNPGGDWIAQEGIANPLCTSGVGSGGTSGAGGSAGASAGSGGATLAYSLVTSSLVDGPGSTHWEQGRDVAFDSAGNVVVVGGTSSLNFPTTVGAYDRVYSGGGGVDGRGSAGDTDVFVNKFDRSGHMLWGTFIGGFNYDRAYAVEIATNGDVVIAGRAGDGFPTTAGALQPTFAGDNDASPLYGKQDGFVARLKADGSGLVWSTYFGSTGQGIIRDMALDAQDNVYVALTGENAPLAYAPQNATGRNTTAPNHWNGYYGKISADGAQLLFGTFYGGTNGAQDSVNPSIRVVNGEAYIVASTDATDVDCISANAYQHTNAGGADLLVMHFAADYHKVFCSYLGGAGDEVLETHTLALTSAGNLVVGGGTTSTNFPTTVGVVQASSGGGYDGMIAVMSGDGTALTAATYIGGSGSDGVEGLAIDPASGDVLFSGSSDGGLPITTGALQATHTNRDGMFGRFTPDLRGARYLTYFGGGLQDEFRALAVAPNGDIALTGQTESADFPLKNPFGTTIDPGSYSPGQAVVYSVFGLAP